MNQIKHQVRFPEGSSDLRNQEYFFATHEGKEHKYHLQQYEDVFNVPGLYEAVTTKLKYQSPATVAMQLIAQVIKAKSDIDSLIVLEIAAGTGFAGKELASLGVKSIVGVDIIPEAAEAAQRDYPGVYDKYYVEDLVNITPATYKALVERDFNCLMCCSSLSCHFPVQGFINSFNLIQTDGWIVFNVSTYIIEDTEDEESFEYKKAVEFRQLYLYMIKVGILEVTNKHYYLHRLLTNGTPLNYVAVTARKRSNISENWLECI